MRCSATKFKIYKVNKKLISIEKIEEKGEGTVSSSKNKEEMKIKTTLSVSYRNDSGQEKNMFRNENGDLVETKLRIGLGFSGVAASKICINLKAPSSLKLSQNYFEISRIKPSGTPPSFNITFTVSNFIPMAEPAIEIIMSYEYQNESKIFFIRRKYDWFFLQKNFYSSLELYFDESAAEGGGF